jgi:hypothetical protein
LKAVPSAYVECVQEPGLDRHEWESEWASIEPDVHDDPANAVPELDDLVRRMLLARGYDLDDPVAREGEERDVVAEYHAAREVRGLIEGSPVVDPGDVAAAVEGYRALFEYLIEQRSAP